MPSAPRLGVGYFGASTGAAAALVAAAREPRPVRAPTLLVVGGADVPVIEMNRSALAELDCVKRLEIVPRATHLFEEPGTLERVAELATTWFAQHLLPEEQRVGAP